MNYEAELLAEQIATNSAYVGCVFGLLAAVFFDGGRQRAAGSSFMQDWQAAGRPVQGVTATFLVVAFLLSAYTRTIDTLFVSGSGFGFAFFLVGLLKLFLSRFWRARRRSVE